ncbi:hypothetical protein [Amycolatopsis anabasis]|uniref:hypothetical protein n=1 Tax=Amycolatopsis anabasis TaxID=1840409 RepID=UPI001FE3AB98|nr:hypothetical protein [Amycolatopsis anabasis]
MAPPPSSANSEAAVRWVDGYCGTIGDFAAASKASGAKITSGTVTAGQAKRETSDWLGEYATILGRAIDGLTALPPAPAPAGDAAKKTSLEKFTAARDRTVAAKTQLDAASANNTAAHDRAAKDMAAVQEDAVGAIKSLIPAIRTPELVTAVLAAPRCQQVE